MEKEVLKLEDTLFNSLLIGLVNKVDGVYTFIHSPSSCRSITQDALYTITRPKAINHRRPDLMRNIPLNIEKTSVGIQDIKIDLERATKRLKILNRLEEKYGLEKTEIYFTGDKGVVCIGDKLWQSCLWKMSIYTLLLKKVCATSIGFHGAKQDRMLLKTFNCYQKELMSQMKTDMEPDLISNNGPNSDYIVHSYSGFYEILRGRNELMRKRLNLELRKSPVDWVI